jgi:pSer/pThr/pTyr-binding forkhead associated (FHA) protein
MNPKDFFFERVIEENGENNVVEKKHKAISFTQDQAEYTIGRHADCDKRIEGSRAISRFHCKIVFMDSKIFIEDLSKSNGTFLNGDRVSIFYNQ